MDLNMAMSFIRWDEQRKAARASAFRAEQNLILSKQKFALSEKKFAFDYAKEMQRQREGEIRKEKETISSWINSYHNAKDLATKSSVVETMKNYYYSLSKSHQAELEPYIKRSPLSPMQTKQREFWRVNEYPEEPSIEEWKENSYPVANYVFAAADIKAKFDNFMTGTPIKRKSFMGMREGNIAYRNEEGMVSIFTSEEMAHKQVADNLKIPLVDLYANDGWHTSKESIGSVERGGEIFDVFQKKNYLRKPIMEKVRDEGGEVVPDKFAPAPGEEAIVYKFARTAVNPSPVQLPPTTKKLIEDIVGDVEDNELAQNLRKRILKGGESAERVLFQLETDNPGFHFSIDFEKMGLLETVWERLPILGWFIKNEESYVTIATTQGTQTLIPVPGSEDRIVWIDRFGIIRNKYGSTLGKSPEEAGMRIAERLKREEE